MVDKAYDAFSQGRDTGTKARVTDRKRVDTLTDPNRYQMPPSRRLRVSAKNKDMFTMPGKDGITKFAESLSEVQPKLMDYLTTEQAKENKEQIQAGIEAAMANEAMKNGDTEFADNKWKQYGYDHHMTYAKAEKYAQQLQLDLAKKPPLQDFDEWYADYHTARLEEDPDLGNISEDHKASYNKVVSKALVNARSASMVTQDNEETRMHLAASSNYVQGTLTEVIRGGGVINNEVVEAIIADERLMNRWNRDQANKIIMSAISNVALGEKDPDNPGEYLTEPNLDLLDYLKEGRGPDGKLASVAVTNPTEYRALENKIYAAKRELRNHRARVEKEKQDAIVADTDSMYKELKLTIGDPESFALSFEDINPREVAKQAIEGAMVNYQQAVTRFQNEYNYTIDQARKAAREQVMASPLVAKNQSKAFREYQEMKRNENQSSASYFQVQTDTLKTLRPEEQIAFKASQLDEVQGGKSWAEVMPRWDDVDENGEPFLHPDHKAAYIKEAEQAQFARNLAIADKKKNDATAMDARVTAQGPLTSDGKPNLIHKSADGQTITEPLVTEAVRNSEEYTGENPTTIPLTAEEEKAFEIMYTKSEDRRNKRIEQERADAGKLELEFDNAFEMVPNIVKNQDGTYRQDGFKENPKDDRVVDRDYKIDPTDNEGLTGYDKVNEVWYGSSSTEDKDFGFPSYSGSEILYNYVEPAVDAVVNKFNQLKEIFNRPVPDSILVNPMDDKPMEGPTVPQSTEGKTYEPAEDRWVDEVPQVETNPRLNTVSESDKAAQNSFTEKLKSQESSGRYTVVSKQNNKEHMGAYQFGKARLTDYKRASGKTFSKKEFLNNPKLQDEIFAWHVQDYKQRIVKDGLDKYIGTEINGTEVTMDGLVAVAHLGGYPGMINFLRMQGKGKADRSDENGTKMSKYLRQFKNT